ncbi:MAG: ion transporter [Pseudomonadota bacterium]
MIDRLKFVLADKRTEWFITGLIILNAITLGLETSDWAMANFGGTLLTVDKLILSIFVIEIAARLFVHRLRFFKDPWSIFDFTVVAIALMPSQGALSVLRALRILRVLRLITVVPSLKRVVGALIGALPGMGSIIFLMSLLFYVFSVMATKLFGDSFPDWFGSIPLSAYSLFQIMTLESWSMGIVRPIMEVYPYAWAFFVPFILSTTFVILNLFIGIVVSAMQAEHEAEAQADRDMIHDENVALMEELKLVRGEIASLKQEITGQRQGSVPSPETSG